LRYGAAVQKEMMGRRVRTAGKMRANSAALARDEPHMHTAAGVKPKRRYQPSFALRRRKIVRVIGEMERTKREEVRPALLFKT